MYETIYVPVDNSDYSNRAIATALELGKKFESRLVGSHVYAAQMHDYRFRQMEYTLPDEYLEESELERQRKIHDSLITTGLQLISDSYLDHMQRQCAEAGLEFEPKMMDGKHHIELIKDIREHGYELTVIGALGIGRVRDSQIGSVCERVTRTVDRDVLVIKHIPEDDEPERDTILVGIDGSPQSFGALVTAIELARRFDKKVETIAVYDPYLHYSVFNGVVDVLTEKAAKVFRFEEQNQLHEEIIDTGLAQIYQSHLDVGAKIAAEHAMEIGKTLLDGKAFQKILDHVRKTNPWMLVIGRIGVHGSPDEQGLGSNAENLLRQCPCDLLLTTRVEYPELDVKAEESMRWTPEAEERMKRVPPLVKGIARTAIYRLAVEKGHSVITSTVLDEAMARYMPGYTSQQSERLAAAVAIERARAGAVAVCRKCGVTAAEAEPVRCSVCGGSAFERVTPEMLERIAEVEGGLREESTYDGRTLKWTQEAKRVLWTMKDAYQRRRTKARVEKSARLRRLSTVTLDFARRIVEEETGVPLQLGETPLEQAASRGNGGNADLKLIARDDKHNPLFSTRSWTPQAVDRIFRVPGGFMRKRTQERVEKLADQRGVERIDLALVEEGLEIGRRLMEETIRGQEPAAETRPAAKCPFGGDGDPSRVRDRDGAPYLNEVGLLSALEQKRKRAD